jgi:hypothetical protein
MMFVRLVDRETHCRVRRQKSLGFTDESYRLHESLDLQICAERVSPDCGSPGPASVISILRNDNDRCPSFKKLKRGFLIGPLFETERFSSIVGQIGWGLLAQATMFHDCEFSRILKF